MGIIKCNKVALLFWLYVKLLYTRTVMNNPTKQFLWMIAILSFMYVASGGALAMHLGLEDYDPCHPRHGDGHDECDHDKKEDHGSHQCEICQYLGLVVKKMLVAPVLLIPVLSVADQRLSFGVNPVVQSRTFLSLLPRAPPA